MSIAKPKFVRRPISRPLYQSALQSGYSPFQASIIAGRIDESHCDDIKRIVSPSISDLSHPYALPDTHKATQRLADAIYNKENILINSDFDCDGTSSNVVIYNALLQFGVPKERIHSYFAHRARDGYGVSDNVANRIIETAPRPCLVITADQGSADQDRIATLKAAGIDTIITDHHGIHPDGPPKDAIACVNPQRSDSKYTDKNIAGVFVAWLLMCALRLKLIKDGFLPDTAPKLTHLADFVAIGVVADCTSIGKSINNRAMVNLGLSLMNKPDARPPFLALRKMLNKSTPYTAQDLSFLLGPLVNSSSRIDGVTEAMQFLLAEDEDTADAALKALNDRNLQRRAIQQEMMQQACLIAEQQVNDNRNSCVIYLPTGQGSIHGIVASQIVQLTGRPTAMVAPKPEQDDLLTCSMRSIPRVHMLEVLNTIQRDNPGIIKAGGGHQGAAGATLYRDKLDQFSSAFEQAVNQQIGNRLPEHVLLLDGDLPPGFGFDVLSEINSLAPFGREFESPIFRLQAHVVQIKVLKEKHLKMLIQPTHDRSRTLNAIWFGAITQDPETGQLVHPDLQYDHSIDFAVELDVNEYRGNRSLQLMIRQAFQQSTTARKP